MLSNEQMFYMRIESAFPEFLEHCGLAIGLGWYPLMHCLVNALADISRTTGARFEATCVKEKFGTLRVYFDASGGGTDAQEVAHLFVDLAEHLSTGICEVCSAAGSINVGEAWLRARCTSHKSSRDYPLNPKVIEGLLSTSLPKMDLSVLPKMGRIERPWESPFDSDSRLTIVTYRSLDDYSRATVSDIEILDVIGWFASYKQANETAMNMGCRVIQHRSVPELKLPSKLKSTGDIFYINRD